MSSRATEYISQQLDQLTEEVSRRAAIYEERTGDWLAMNALAKMTWMSSAAGLAINTLASTGETGGSILTPLTLYAGGLMLDRATGGLQAYHYGVDQRETN